MGTDKTKLTQNFRRNAAVLCPPCLLYSHCSPFFLVPRLSSLVPCLLSLVSTNAIPHSGHIPGFSFIISGCMGQVYAINEFIIFRFARLTSRFSSRYFPNS